jgi:hypothetical protein
MRQPRVQKKPIVAAAISTIQAAAITGVTLQAKEAAPDLKALNSNPQLTIRLASLRTQIKKLQRQISVQPDDDKAEQLEALQLELQQLADS